MTLSLIAAALITGQPIVNDDFLEPSVLNEVDHALALAPTNAPAFAPVTVTNGVANPVTDVFATNGLTATEKAIRLISSQKSDGRWYCGTNDVTAVAVGILRGLRAEEE